MSKGMLQITFVLGVAMALLMACSALFAPRPELNWDANPEAVILTVSTGGGFVPEHVWFNTLVDARVWGDGRIVWVEQQADGARMVYEGQLSRAALVAFLERASQAGFFGWKDLYSNQNVADASTRCISIHLLSRSKEVCEYYEGAPEGFEDLYALAADGLGAQGEPYVPERGYLIASEVIYEAPPESVLEWDTAAVGFELSDAEDGIWVEGLVLLAAWEGINSDSWGAAPFSDGTGYYVLTLQIPGLSLNEPPSAIP